MQQRRAELDGVAFVAALGALGLATLGFVATLNGAAVIMCSILFAGLVAGRLAGITGSTLLVVALGVSFLLWIVWVDPVTGPRRTAALAHFAGGALGGWAIALTLRRRGWRAWAPAALGTVFALTVAWELGELIGDRLLQTALIPDRTDSALDIFFGCIGGLLGVGIGAFTHRARPADSVVT